MSFGASSRWNRPDRTGSAPGDDLRQRFVEELHESRRGEDVAPRLGSGGQVGPPISSTLALQRRSVVAGAVELAVADGVEAQQRVGDPLLVERQALLVVRRVASAGSVGPLSKTPISNWT